MLHCIHELWFQLFFEGNVSISFVCRFNIRFLGAGGKQLNQELIVGVCVVQLWRWVAAARNVTASARAKTESLAAMWDHWSWARISPRSGEILARCQGLFLLTFEHFQLSGQNHVLSEFREGRHVGRRIVAAWSCTSSEKTCGPRDWLVWQWSLLPWHQSSQHHCDIPLGASYMAGLLPRQALRCHGASALKLWQKLSGFPERMKPIWWSQTAKLETENHKFEMLSIVTTSFHFN